MSPRKRKDVTPTTDPPPEVRAGENVPLVGPGDPAEDDLDAFAEELTPSTVVVEDVSEDELTDTGRAIVRAAEVMADFGTALQALQALPAIPLDTPDQRELAVRLYNRLEPVEKAVGLWRRMVEARFRAFLEREDADRATLPDGRFVSVTQPESRWRVDGQAMKRALDELVVDGVLTQAQVDDAIHAEVVYVADNTKLNQLARHHGARVERAITVNRVREQATGSGKVNIPKVVA